ncbi:MAG TPA: hypothetical protein VD970_00105 [Acetobacteraceae bacterium]|nr:hypothetical protein [Acetobacteraceae bacterium]
MPPNQTSVRGLSFSAMSCASASPEPFCTMLTLVPVVRAYTVAIMLHHSACTEQITFSCPWAEAAHDNAANPMPAIHLRMSISVIDPSRKLNGPVLHGWAVEPPVEPQA